MNKYESEAIGNIILIKDIVFNKHSKKSLDHAFSTGRPCLIIYSDNEYDYLLTMTSHPNPNFINQLFPITEDDLMYRVTKRYNNFNAKNKNKIILDGSLQLSNIYKIPISGYQELGKLSLRTFKNVISSLKYYHKSTLEELITKAQNIKGR